ncbi:MAG: hypothetical protein H0T42_31215 [Deltaproteobacteria bacterium]|nr:hypothetical protein [Deltaproteobacteria bacterium]
MTTALVVVDPAKRTVVTFTLKGDPWPTIASWAQQHRYLPRDPQTGATKLFQKGSGLFTAPMRAQFTQRGKEIELQAWVHVPLLTRIMSLFLLPQEMSVRSGGFRAMVPRAIARKAVNELLAQVGAEPIP